MPSFGNYGIVLKPCMFITTAKAETPSGFWILKVNIVKKKSSLCVLCKGSFGSTAAGVSHWQGRSLSGVGRWIGSSPQRPLCDPIQLPSPDFALK